MTDRPASSITAVDMSEEITQLRSQLAKTQKIKMALATDKINLRQKLADAQGKLAEAEAYALRVGEAVREAAADMRDELADVIGAAPMSSIHSALSEYRNAIRALDVSKIAKEVR